MRACRGVCPGNHRSAGKNKSTCTTQGNRWLKGALTHNKDGHLREKFWRIAPKNRSKAVIAVAHDLLVLAYFVLQRGTPYEEKRGVSMSEEQRQRLIRHYVRSARQARYSGLSIGQTCTPIG
jgi:transposase